MCLATRIGFWLAKLWIGDGAFRYAHNIGSLMSVDAVLLCCCTVALLWATGSVPWGGYYAVFRVFRGDGASGGGYPTLKEQRVPYFLPQNRIRGSTIE